LFTRRGQAKLSDYSLTKTSLISGLLDGTSHDQITPMYLAPELIRKEKATPQSDIYSLGITLYLLFTEKLPFNVDSLIKLYNCHLRVVPDHPTMVNKKCPQALGDIIMRMIDKKPENRFQDCDQLRIALSDVGQSRI
jgi:serine/threonine-protein kinase